MNSAVLEFVTRARRGASLTIECGAAEVNGSIPRVGRHVGFDIQPGTGVDVVGDVHALPVSTGVADVVIACELLEHVRNWHLALTELRRILRPGGQLLLTTRSPGFPYHGYPYDFWRFTTDDMRQIFPGARIESDPESPGVFIDTTGDFPAARPPVFSMIARRRVHRTHPWDYLAFGGWAARRLLARLAR